MHTSTNVKVVIDADSTPIIEKCKGIKFGNYNSTKDLDVQDFDSPNAGQAQTWTRLDDTESHSIQDTVIALATASKHDTDKVLMVLKTLGI